MKTKTLYYTAFFVILAVIMGFFKAYVDENLIYLRLKPYAQKISQLQRKLAILKRYRASYRTEQLRNTGREILEYDRSRYQEIDFVIFFNDQHKALESSRLLKSEQIFNEILDNINNNFQTLQSKDYLLERRYGYIIFLFNTKNGINDIAAVAAGFRNPELFSALESIWLVTILAFAGLYILFIIIFKNIGPLTAAAENRIMTNSEHAPPAVNKAVYNVTAPVSPEKSGEKFYKEEFAGRNPDLSDEKIQQPSIVFAEEQTKMPLPADNNNKNEEKPAAQDIRNFKEIFQHKKKLEDQLEELALAREITLASNSMPDFGNFIKTVFSLLHSKIDTDEIFLFLRKESEDDVLELKGHFDGKETRIYQNGEKDEDKIILGFGTEGKSLGKKLSIIHSGFSSESILTLPLIDKNKITGALRLYKKENDFFREKDKFVISKLASHLAVALNNVVLYETAITDGLTGLFIHRHFQNVLKNELDRSIRYNTQLSLALIDIDFFKKFNDTYGHQAGDYVLKNVAACIKNNLRSADQAFRYGGEEFAVIFVNTAAGEAVAVCEKLRGLVAGHDFVFNNAKLSAAISIGITSLHNRKIGKDELISEADQALYDAKKQGRNRSVCFSEQKKIPSEN